MQPYTRGAGPMRKREREMRDIDPYIPKRTSELGLLCPPLQASRQSLISLAVLPIRAHRVYLYIFPSASMPGITATTEVYAPPRTQFGYELRETARKHLPRVYARDFAAAARGRFLNFHGAYSLLQGNVIAG